MVKKEYRVDLVNGPSNGPVSVLRYQNEIMGFLPHVEFNRMEYHYSQNMLVAICTRISYAMRVLFGMRKGSIKHITWFELSHLLYLPGMGRTVVTVYDVIPLERAKDMSRFARFRTWVNAIALRRADAIITISDYSASNIHRRLGVPREKIFVAKPGIDLSHFRPVKKDPKAWGSEGRRVVLALSSEDPRQNVDKILIAVSRLKKRYPGILFLKAGRPQWAGGREKLLFLVEKLGLQRNVRFLDFVPEEKLPSLYSSADVLVYPCSSAGWGLPPAEALACGTPVITSKNGPLPEVVGSCAICIDPEDADEIAHAISRVFSESKLSVKMRKCGLQRASQFSWNKAALQFDRVYRKVLDGG